MNKPAVMTPHTPSNRLAEVIVAWALGLTIVLALPFGRYLHKGMAPLLVACGLIGIAYCLIRRTGIRFNALVGTSLLFVALALLSTIWSPTPDVTLKTSLSLVGTLLCAYGLFYLVVNLTNAPRRLVVHIFVYGGLIGLVLISIDMIPQEIRDFIRGRSVYSEFSVAFWNPRKPGLSIAALIVWPWTIAAWHVLPRYVTCTTLALFSVTLGLSEADSARSALIIAATAAACAYMSWRSVLRISAALLVILIFASPLIPRIMTDPMSMEARYEGFSPSALHRLVIWRNAAEKIPDHPILGFGFDTARSFYSGSSARLQILLPGTVNPLNVFSEPIPLHPHNMLLQIWMELGAVGAGIFAIFVCLILRTIDRHCRDRATAAVAFGTLISCLFIANISFGAWQAWWVSTLILVAALMVLVLRSLDKPH